MLIRLVYVYTKYMFNPRFVVLRYVKYIRLIYLTIVANVVILCLLIVIIKALNWDIFTKWNMSMLPLSNWYFQFANLFLVSIFFFN